MSIYRGKNRREFYLSSLLYDSIEDNNLGAVKSLLIEKGADPNIVLPRKGISPFHLAIGCDSNDFTVKVVRLILQHGGNPNVRSDDGLTPVHIAAAWGRLEVLQLLLSCGGDPEARDSNYMTPFHYAKKENFVDCLELLKSHFVNKTHFIQREKEDCICKIELDKVIVNNGSTEGEYKLLEVTGSIKKEKSIPNLQNLPQSDTNEYVMNWFSKHVDDIGGKTFIKVPATAGTSESEDQSFFSFESSVDESDNPSARKITPQDITFRKAYRKKRKISKDGSGCRERTDRVPVKLNTSTPMKGNPARKLSFTPDELSPNDVSKTPPEPKTEVISSESGIVTLSNSKECTPSSCKADHVALPHSVTDSASSGIFGSVSGEKKNSTSSDYLTCTSNSALNRNVFEITEDLTKSIEDGSKKSDDAASTDLSFMSVSEVYKYEDMEEGIVLYERRLLKAPSECNGSTKTASFSSKMSSLPETFQYDADTLRRELTLHGYDPGPITVTTKRVYLKKLYKLTKNPLLVQDVQHTFSKRIYSVELEKTIRNPSWTDDLELYKSLEETVSKEFSNPDPTRKWREGVNKSSFTYLLLDPRLTGNLPCRADCMKPKEVWETFLSAIFYVGKGKRSRPYSHLYEAVTLWKQNKRTSDNKKLQKILNVWQNNGGVICLHVFQNIIPVEAYTREAAMISALKVENISNVKSGEFYGIASTWPQKHKKMFGAYLLYRAMMIFVNEGERQLFPSDID
ncbi:uncharacterized protein [Leptinotarsa decemlineata]|uniref:uncharacterized protein n=1 Tax=Leptinotarsa decemlineata TaxID=7539 RepID=UPI000C253005|nr:ankyrin repeat and LEM domain-containing protein 1-like [Leptinotarsa decemlineata]